MTGSWLYDEHENALVQYDGGALDPPCNYKGTWNYKLSGSSTYKRVYAASYTTGCHEWDSYGPTKGVRLALGSSMCGQMLVDWGDKITNNSCGTVG